MEGIKTSVPLFYTGAYLLICHLFFSVAYGEQGNINQLIYFSVLNGNESGVLRYSYSPSVMRIDQNEDKGRYLIYDRRTNFTTWVDDQKQTYRHLLPSEIPFSSSREIAIASNKKSAVEVEGYTPVEYELYAGNRRCAVVATVPIYRDISAWLQDYAQFSFLFLLDTPFRLDKDIDQEDCVSLLAFGIGKIIEKLGFMVYWHSVYGHSAHLVETKRVEIFSDDFFSIPEGYQALSP